MTENESRKVSQCIAHFVEDMNADSVVVLWTSIEKDSTKAKVASWGNQYAIKQMVIDLAAEYDVDDDAKPKKGKTK